MANFWGKVKAFGKAISSGFDKFVETGSIAKAYDAGKSTYKEYAKSFTSTGTSITGGGTSCPPPNPTGGKGGGDVREFDLLSFKRDLIDDYHEDARKKAADCEASSRNLYEDTFEKLYNEFEKIMDINPIRDFVQTKSKEFSNVMRNDLNYDVSVNNKKLDRLLTKYYYSEIDASEVDDYVDGLYDKAKTHLLELVEKTVDETIKYIKSYTQKYLSDEAEAIRKTKEHLENLKKNGDAREKVLLSLAEEEAILTLIQSIANDKN